jgi:predicted O-linked N-acetylglucosamine transferase (SPINDLY family)
MLEHYAVFVQNLPSMTQTINSPIQPPQAELKVLITLYKTARYAELESQSQQLIGEYPSAGILWKLLGASLTMQAKDALYALQQSAALLPLDAEARNNLGIAFQERGELDAARNSYLDALKIKPDYAEAHYNTGNVLHELGQIEEAVASYRHALHFQPDFVAAYSNLGSALILLKQFNEAVKCFRQALLIQPNAVDTLNNLGTALKELGQFNEALICYRQALQIKPDYADAHYNLGNALKDMGRLEEAVISYNQALRLKPNFIVVHNNLGFVFEQLGKIREALQHYQQAAEIDPLSVEAHSNLGGILQSIGRTDEALLCFQKTRELRPQLLQYAIQATMLLPVIPESVDAIKYWREHFQNGIKELLNAPGSPENSFEQLSDGPFFLAYHNTNDRPVMEALCQLYRKRVPDLTYTASHLSCYPGVSAAGSEAGMLPKPEGQRIKVGFLSELLTDHTIGKHYKGFIEHLDRSRFEVVVIHAPKAKQDAFRKGLDELADKAITLPEKLKIQQQVVAAEQLDVLFYPDIGMSSATYFLAYSRLAPVQATSWGHPDTSGLDTMDYYVSAISNEAENAQDYFTERLIRLNRLPCFYYQTPAASIQQYSKAELGLPMSGTLYGSPQSLFKFHPDFDAVLAEIAEGDPTGYIILPEGKYPDWTEIIKARWAKTYPILLLRVVFMPNMNWGRFMAGLSHMDVLLDPLHFGSGNTFYDAMVFGTPMVTWPGTFGRGRNVAAAYQQMGVVDTPVANQLEDYAPLALALGRDTARREVLRKTLLAAASQHLFEDMQVVREFESFLEDAVAVAGRGDKLPQDWRANKT